ncbi:ATP-binding cassette domain-containing protein [Allomuricauda sp. SCSIO 65647]|uniref:ATP-binding cassette domain-containing protein n=1 Tax=Allomuricauda sp. SCSIO 65647 TaxID=2908843 RepID=UPI001F186047|nr:ATP-binding cassette domain-containing protein [Muricauda sp. SCSIO 65647]UJH66754.1 ATP-binding cassette domain-containing protein [Muricauda sp. SCSIO 65647]
MILEIDSVELSFGERQILYGIYVKAEKGKVTGILGKNGSGKTCLMRIIFGSLIPKHKSLRIDGDFLKIPLFLKNDITYLPQHQLLPMNLTLQKAFKWYKISFDDFIDKFKSFKKYCDKKAHELSSGELRVVETYLILNSRKGIILLDEPFSFIAPLYVEKFKHLIHEKKNSSAIIITDHFYRDILEVSDLMYFLKNGCSKMVTSEKDLQNEGYLIAARNLQ